MEEQEDKNFNSSELFEIFQFMLAFPFKDYEISIEKDNFDPKKLGIDPIIINNVTGLETPNMVNFFYLEKESQILISFYESDIDFIKEKSKEITELDSVRKVIDDGLDSESLKEKIVSIKKIQKFINKIIPNSKESSIFSDVLIELLTVNEVSLNQKLITSVQNLNVKLDKSKLSKPEIDVVSAYYNFQLHHAKIILGIVIAVKIY